MSARWTRWTAWMLAAASFTSLVGAVALGLQRRDEDIGDVHPFVMTEAVFYGTAFVAFAILGALILSRDSRNRIGWVFLAAGFSELFGVFGTEYGVYALVRSPGSLPFAAEVLWAADLFGSLGFALFPLFFLLFPDGGVVSRAWRVVIWAVAVAAAMLTLHALINWKLRGPRMLGPIEVKDVGWVDYLGETAFIIVTGALLAGAISLVVRFRRAPSDQRQQIKWLVYAGAVFAVLMLLDSIGVSGEGNIVALIVSGFSILMLPVGAGIAILRYRLYDIDIIVNRTIVYAALTAMLAAAYLGIVILLQTVLQPLTAESDIAVAGSTLAVAALFRPLRARVQAFIDRRFYRRRYDAATTLVDFASHVRDQVDLDSLSQELVRVVGTTMQPAHASLWLRAEGSR